MSYVNTPITNNNGPVIEIFIHNPSNGNSKKGLFLIDTGASGSCVKKDFLNELGLNAVGSQFIRTPSTEGNGVECLVFSADLIFGLHGIRIQDVKIVEVILGEQTIDGLLGRDILCKGLLIYNGADNKFTLAF